MKNNRAVHLLITLVLVNAATMSGITSKVVLTGGGTERFRNEVADRLTAIVNQLDNQTWAKMSKHCTLVGLASLKDLVKKTGCRNVNPLYVSKLLSLPDGNYEVRDIKVKVNMRKTKGNPFQYMVFTFSPDGLLDDVRFAMELAHYRENIIKGEQLGDLKFRLQILQFLEIFRTAYNRMDLDYLRKVYSEDALIIVGIVLQEKPGEQGYLENAGMPRERVQFLKLSKLEYIERLERIFRDNAFIKVNFDQVTINRHPKFNEIYGVTLKQNYRTPGYYDEGWLFLMIDFKDQTKPLIHVRSWQPEKFPDGSVISLGDFELIE